MHIWVHANGRQTVRGVQQEFTMQTDALDEHKPVILSQSSRMEQRLAGAQ